MLETAVRNVLRHNGRSNCVLLHTASAQGAKIVKNWGKISEFCMSEAILCGNAGFECQKMRVFCDFCMTESVLTKRFASYGFRSSVQKEWKLPKTEVFWNFYMPESIFVWQPGPQVSKIEGFLRFLHVRICPDETFRFITLVSEGFQFQRGFRGVSNLRRFQRGFRGVSEGRKTEWRTKRGADGDVFFSGQFCNWIFVVKKGRVLRGGLGGQLISERFSSSMGGGRVETKR